MREPVNRDDVFRQIAEACRLDRETPRQFVRALLAGDREQLVAVLDTLDFRYEGWRNAFRLCAGLTAIPDDMKDAMLTLCIRMGDHIRSEVGDDMILVKALRATLLPYTGPGLTLYRGDSAWNRRRRTYGLAWSSKRETARAYAIGRLWRSSQGGQCPIAGRSRAGDDHLRPVFAGRSLRRG